MADQHPFTEFARAASPAARENAPQARMPFVKPAVEDLGSLTRLTLVPGSL